MAFINLIAALSSVKINKWMFNAHGQDKRQVLRAKSRRADLRDKRPEAMETEPGL